MNTVALDTHRIVKRLVEGGFSTSQAEIVTDVVRESRDFDLSSLATKADLTAIDAKVSALDVKVTALDAKVTALDAKVTALDGRMSAVEGRLATLDVKLTGVEGRLDAKIEARIEAAKNDLLKWVIGIILVQGGVVVTLIKLLPGAH